MLKNICLCQLILICNAYPNCINKASDITEEENLLSATSSFGKKIFKSLQVTSSENFIFSPFSIRSTMTMLALTQSGNLDPNFRELMCFQSNIKYDSGALHNVIQSFKGSGIQMINGVFGNNMVNISNEFIHEIELLNGTVTNIDFIQEEKAIKVMNDFVSQATNDKISKIIKKGDLDSLLPAVFINVFYFKEEWKIEFKTDNYLERVFFLDNGKTVRPEFITIKSEISIFEGKHAVYFELLYTDSNYSMLVGVPDEFEYFEPSLEDTYHAIESLSPKVVEIVMPRLKILKEIDLKSVFSKLGVSKIFSHNAGIWDHVFESDKSVIHKAFIEINEKGTEAAAVTSTRGTRAKQLSIIVDRPFWFSILKKGQSHKKYPVLMMGRVIDPTE